MNTVVGLILLVVNGSIVQSTPAHFFPDLKTCNDTLHEAIKNAGVEPPEGGKIGVLCLQLADDINDKPKAPKPPSTSL